MMKQGAGQRSQHERRQLRQWDLQQVAAASDGSASDAALTYDPYRKLRY